MKHCLRDLTFFRFDTIPHCERRTDIQTDRCRQHAPGDQIIAPILTRLCALIKSIPVTNTHRGLVQTVNSMADGRLCEKTLLPVFTHRKPQNTKTKLTGVSLCYKSRHFRTAIVKIVSASDNHKNCVTLAFALMTDRPRHAKAAAPFLCITNNYTPHTCMTSCSAFAVTMSLSCTVYC